VSVDLDVPNLLDEVVLAPEIRPRTDGREREEVQGEGARVLLTGATGFVGAHVLRALLDRGVKRVVCLVRAADADEASNRVMAALDKYGLARPSTSEQLVGLPGDIARPLLGLAPEQFDELAEQVDIIIHGAAWVHLVHTYSTLRDSNVGGTQEVLRLAVTGRVKRVFHLSGMSVHLGCSQMVENGPPDYVHRSNGGYLDTKWVAEKVVWEAFERGVPGAVLRLGWISGHSRSGYISESDALTLFLQACVRLRAAPHFDDDEIQCVPVDMAADVIARVALEGSHDVRAYNLANSHTLYFEELYQACRAVDLEVQERPQEEWLALLQKRLPLLLPVGHSVLKEWDMPPMQNDFAVAMLEKAGRDVTTEELIATYLPVWCRQRPSTIRQRAQGN
jgi:thioester reductase-like protein